MGVGANSSQNKSLRDQKERAAGRQQQKSPEQEAIREAEGESVDKPVGGAHGRDDVAHRERPGNANPGGGIVTEIEQPRE